MFAAPPQDVAGRNAFDYAAALQPKRLSLPPLEPEQQAEATGKQWGTQGKRHGQGAPLLSWVMRITMSS